MGKGDCAREEKSEKRTECQRIRIAVKRNAKVEEKTPQLCGNRIVYKVK